MTASVKIRSPSVSRDDAEQTAAAAPEIAGPVPAPLGVSTKDRILDVAMVQFTEKGYDGTSLREIAEQVGMTKAAIYYHFASKADIFRALHTRLLQFGGSAIEEMTDEPVTLSLWGELLDQFVAQMLSQRQLFLMHERNQAALEKLRGEEHDAQHGDIRVKFLQVFQDPRLPLRDRLKMACSFGAVTGVFMSGDAFQQTPPDTLRAQLHDVVDTILRG